MTDLYPADTLSSPSLRLPHVSSGGNCTAGNAHDVEHVHHPTRPTATRTDTGSQSLTPTLIDESTELVDDGKRLPKEKPIDEEDERIVPTTPTTTEARSSELLPEETVVTTISSSSSQSKWEYLHFGTVLWCFMMLGWNDGSVGPLLPRIQEVYNVGFTIVSLLFVFNFIGYITGATMNIWLNDKLGLGKTMVIGASFNIATYAIQSSAPPFPVLILSFCFAGFGSALQGAQGNGFVGSIKKNKATKLMLLHAAYGLGAFASPFLATHFAVQSHWSFHYLSSLAIAVINVILQLVVFRLKRQEELLREIGQFDEDSEKTNSAGASATSTIVAGADIEKAPTSDAVIEQGEGEEKKKSLYGQIFGIRVVHYLTAFALIYIGVECSVGSWIVTFIIRERNGGDSAGYISSGFFGGLMLGRLILIPVNKWVGEYIVVYIYMILSIAAQITIWVVPSIIENAIAASFIGFLLGPIFPIIVGQAVRVLPPTLFTGAVGWITGVGVAGSAVLPFITGLLATKYGIGSLQPFMVAMMCTMVCIWMLVPKRR